MADIPNLGGMYDRDNPWNLSAPGAVPEPQPLSTAMQARNLAQDVLVAERNKNYARDNKDFQDAHDWERVELEYYRKLVALVGEDEARRLTSGVSIQAATDDAAEEMESAEPDLFDIAAYLRGGEIPINAGSDKHPLILKHKFDDLPPETQEQIRQQVEDIYKQTGNRDPLDMLGQVGRMSPDWLAANAEKLRQQQEQKAADRNARLARQEELARIGREERQKAEARKAAREAQLDAERKQANERREDRLDAEARARQADRQNAQNLRAAGYLRQVGRDKQAQADRAQREADRDAAKQNAIQKALERTEARRKQLALGAATRIATTAARTQVRLEGLPRPGGIGLLLLAIVVILFAIQPVNPNGATRLQLIWLSLLPWSTLALPDDTGGANGATGGNVGNLVPPFLFGAGLVGRQLLGNVPGGQGINQLSPMSPPGSGGGVGGLGEFGLGPELPYALQSVPF